MDHKATITAALRKLGPSGPGVIADNVGMEPSVVGYHLRALLVAKTVKARGKSRGIVYALMDQEFDDQVAPPPGAQETASEETPEGAQGARHPAGSGADARSRGRDHHRPAPGRHRPRTGARDLQPGAHAPHRHAAP